ncbi:MAG: hypothetical protein ACLR2O_06520 [Coprococcus sp.]
MQPGNAKRVIGEELNKDAVKDARINAKKMASRMPAIYAGDAGRFMVDMASKNQSRCGIHGSAESRK